MKDFFARFDAQVKFALIAISLIEGVRSIAISVQDGQYLDMYTIGFTQTQNKGMHKKIYEEFLKSAKALREGISTHLKEY